MAESHPKECLREDNSSLLDQYIDCARKFIDLAKDLEHIKGASKLQRMLRSELKYLQTLQKCSSTEVCGNHLKSSNLGHFAGCIHAAYNAPGVVQILSPFAMDGRSENLVVDVVANQGHTWVKVIARKAQALHLIWAEPMAACLERLGVSVSGERVQVDEGTANQISLACIASSSEEEDSDESSSSESENNESVLRQKGLSRYSEACPVKQASFKHSGDLNCEKNTASTKSWQISKNVQMFNEMSLLYSLVASLPQFECLLDKSSGTESPSPSVIQKVNLDITTLITLVSSVTNGGCHFEFSEKVLAQQAAEERREPVLPKLKQFLHGKKMYVCQTALDDFRSILETLGGPEEKRRAEELLSDVTIVQDDPSDRTKDMPYSLKIRDRSKVIFGTGDKLQAVTVTANSSFVRAAQHQGVSFAVHLHPSRALTEEKEKSALPLSSED